MSITSETQLPKDGSGWLDPTMDSVRGTETPKDPNKGYIALLGWSVNAIKAAQKFDRRYHSAGRISPTSSLTNGCPLQKRRFLTG